MHRLGQDLEWEREKMQFLIELLENRSFALSNNVHTRGFELFTLSLFPFSSLLKQVSGYSQILCVYGAVLGPFSDLYFQWRTPVGQPHVMNCWAVRMFGRNGNKAATRWSGSGTQTPGWGCRQQPGRGLASAATFSTADLRLTGLFTKDPVAKCLQSLWGTLRLSKASFSSQCLWIFQIATGPFPAADAQLLPFST